MQFDICDVAIFFIDPGPSFLKTNIKDNINKDLKLL